MKKLKIGLSILVFSYLAGFFFATPIALALSTKGTTSSIVISVGGYVHGYDYIANGWVVRAFGEDSLVGSIRAKNSHYWCTKFDSCSLTDE